MHVLQREIETTQFMQIAPWLGLIPGTDEQVQQAQDVKNSPIVSLFKSATSVIVSHPRCPSPSSFFTMSKQAEAAGEKLA